jgi:predicted PurR-regulated permease PerM
VVTGVIGVAVIQSLLVGIGLFAGGVPYAGIWTLLCLVLAIVQIGPMPIVLPIVVWYFTAHNITPAVFFAIWMGVTMISDNILKPILYGRGSTVPMLVIFVGAVGGLLYSGIIGLFLGPVFLAFAYELFRHWLNQGEMKPIPELEGGAVDEQPSTEIPKS